MSIRRTFLYPATEDSPCLSSFIRSSLPDDDSCGTIVASDGDEVALELYRGTEADRRQHIAAMKKIISHLNSAIQWVSEGEDD